MRIANVVNDSIVDGPGLRLAVFVQGCHHNCKGCHNVHTHDPNGGYDISVEDILLKLKSNPLLRGLTITGGEPFEQPLTCAKLAMMAKELGYNVWTYTGYTYEQLKDKNNSSYNLLLDNTDVLVDGPFIEKLKSYELKFRGSSNQRLIDVKKTKQYNMIVEYVISEELTSKFRVPES